MTAVGRLVLRLLPASRRASIRAALAEAHAAPSAREAKQWQRAASGMLLRGLLAGPVLDAAALVVAGTAVALLNESRSDAANQMTLAALVLGSGVLGFLWIHRVWIPASLLGAVVAAEHAVALVVGIAEPGIHVPAGLLGIASLLVLVAPAVAAAYCGAVVRRLSKVGNATR